MTSAVTTPPTPPPPPPPTGAPPPLPASASPRPTPTARTRERFADAVAGTPGRMRVMGAIAIVLCLAFGVLGFLALLGFHSNVENARENAEQLVRIQTIRTSLVTADANATNAF